MLRKAGWAVAFLPAIFMVMMIAATGAGYIMFNLFTGRKVLNPQVTKATSHLR